MQQRMNKLLLFFNQHLETRWMRQVTANIRIRYSLVKPLVVSSAPIGFDLGPGDMNTDESVFPHSSTNCGVQRLSLLGMYKVKAKSSIAT